MTGYTLLGRLQDGRELPIHACDCRDCDVISETVADRDAAENAADQMASLILGEPIDWPFHDDAWKRAIDHLMAKTPKEGKPSLKVKSVFGQSRIEMTDGVDVVSLDVTQKEVERLIEEFKTVLQMAD